MSAATTPSSSVSRQPDFPDAAALIALVGAYAAGQGERWQPPADLTSLIAAAARHQLTPLLGTVLADRPGAEPWAATLRQGGFYTVRRPAQLAPLARPDLDALPAPGGPG